VTAALLTVQDVAARLNVPTSWVYARVEAGRLAHLKIGRYVRFDPDAVEQMIAAARQGEGR